MSIRISVGKYKNAVLEIPKSARPTLSKNRQSLFDMIESLNIESNPNDFGEFFKNSVVLDCFAGSGALGTEALSRGASHVYFIDNDKQAISIIKSNIAKIKAEKDATIIFSSVSEFGKIKKSVKDHIDVVFFDPPYEKFPLDEIIKNLSENEIISRDTILIIETRATDPVLNKISESFNVLKSKKSGISGFIIATID